MEDHVAAIPAGEDMIEPDANIEAWFADHGGERSGVVSADQQVTTHA